MGDDKIIRPARLVMIDKDGNESEIYGTVSKVTVEPETVETVALPVSNKVIVIDAGHGEPDERNSLLTLKNNIDLLQKIKCFKHFIFFMLKRRLIYAKQRIW